MSRKRHTPGYCQICDMLENVGHWGPPIATPWPPHGILRYPDPDDEWDDAIAEYRGGSDPRDRDVREEDGAGQG